MSQIEYPVGVIAVWPLIGALLSYLVGLYRPRASGWIATGAAALSFISTAWAVALVGEGLTLSHTAYQWIASGVLEVNLSFYFDELAAVMCLVVTGVGTLIHLYSVGYMREDASRPRYFAYLNLFLFSMLLLVLGRDLVVLFIGWEGVGLCSYLLIGFWYTKYSFAEAGRKAFVVNRIGDAGFLIGMFLLFWHCGTLDIPSLKTMMLDNAEFVGIAMVAGLALFIGATGKSAQIPLFVWLPDAMAGPTPVSALIHAATMVTAGIYMLARLHFVFDPILIPQTMLLVSLVAALTALIAATTAIAQNDIKKVLAYSTVSQLGFMFMASAAGAHGVALFHVVTHAFFKACLFLAAGSVIHACHHEQDMRKLGGLLRYMPVTGVAYGVATLAIAGIYPFSGYFSKHMILMAVGENPNPLVGLAANGLVWIASFTALLTGFYMARSFALTFLGEYRGEGKPHEAPWEMTTPVVALAGLALLAGLWLAEPLLHFIEHSVPVLIEHKHETVLEALLHSWVGFLGVGAGLIAFTYWQGLAAAVARALPSFHQVFRAKWWFDEAYGLLLVRPLERLARFLWKIIDTIVIDGTVNGVAALVEVNGELVRWTQVGQVRVYALAMFVGFVALVAFYVVF